MEKPLALWEIFGKADKGRQEINKINCKMLDNIQLTSFCIKEIQMVSFM